jgi:hypothetical protein
MIRVGGENTTNEMILGDSRLVGVCDRVRYFDIEPYFRHLHGEIQLFRFHDSVIECKFDGV